MSTPVPPAPDAQPGPANPATRPKATKKSRTRKIIWDLLKFGSQP
jgi:hypothetical protein